MKKLILATLLSAAAASAMAVPTTTLYVTGTLSMAGCVPNLSNGGTVDFGNFGPGTLSTTDTNQLGTQNIDLTVTCESPLKVAFGITDDRPDSREPLDVVTPIGTITAAMESSMFGLGKTDDDINIGSYVLEMGGDPTVDGNAGTALLQLGSGGTWADANDRTIASDGNTLITVGSGSTPEAFGTAVFPLSISGAIQNMDTLAITDETELDGQATISLVYL